MRGDFNFKGPIGLSLARCKTWHWLEQMADVSNELRLRTEQSRAPAFTLTSDMGLAAKLWHLHIKIGLHSRSCLRLQCCAPGLGPGSA